MKHSLLILFIFCSIVALSQVNVLVIPTDTIVCFRDSVAFTSIVTGAGTAKISYRWQKNDVDLTDPGANDSIYSIANVLADSQGIYRCIISVEGLGADTSNDAMLSMHPRMYIDNLYRYNPLGCAGECKGQFKTTVSGGTPFKNDPHYIYEWHGGHSQDTIVFGLCPGNYIFTVTDSLSCSIDSAYFVDVLKSPKVTFEILPDTVIYLTNPTIKVVFPDSMRKYITNWTWDFGDSVKVENLNPASHIYMDTLKPGQIPIRLSFTDLNGCDTTISAELSLKKPELDIPNVFTPNDDGINERFEIELMDEYGKSKGDFRIAYLANEFLVFDRWGKKVYDAINYKSEDWDGGRLSDGTYFFILKLTGQYRDEVIRGSVAILRGK